MYIPSHNHETDLTVLHHLIQENPLATMVTLTPAGLEANHIPVILSKDEGDFGILRCHVARKNLIWQNFDPSLEVLAIFHGPAGYISPSWYPSKKKHGKVVPTWNYATVHAYGNITIKEDKDWLLGHLNALSDQNEAQFNNPWAVSDAPADYINKMIPAIVGIEINITRISGKWKMSQNKNKADAAGVINGTKSTNTELSNLVKVRTTVPK